MNPPEAEAAAAAAAKPAEAAANDMSMHRLARYYAILRDFMSYFHSTSDIYPPSHEVSSGSAHHMYTLSLLLGTMNSLRTFAPPLSPRRHHSIFISCVTYVSPSIIQVHRRRTKPHHPRRFDQVDDIQTLQQGGS